MRVISKWVSDFQSLRKNFHTQEERREEFWRLAESMLDHFDSMTHIQLENARKNFAGQDAEMLRGLSRTAAESSVTHQKPERLELGLRALIYAGPRGDLRNTIVELTLLDNSAKKIGTNINGVYQQLQSKVPADDVEVFETLIRCNQEDIGKAIELVQRCQGRFHRCEGRIAFIIYARLITAQ